MRTTLVFRVIFGLALSGCATASALPPRTGTAAIEIRVTEREQPDKPAAWVPVLVQSPLLPQPIELVTDTDGRAAVGHLPGGIYSVQIAEGESDNVGVGDGQRVRVDLHRDPIFVGCGYGRGYGVPQYGIERSLFDDDAATQLFHQPRVVHLLP